MAKLVIEVPEELRGLGEAFATMVARVQGPVAGTRGGTAVDYGQVEQTIAEEAGGIELAAHRTILEALDVDVPTVIIGGLRYTKVGRCEAPYHTLAGSVSIERSLYRQSGQRGGHPGGRVVDPVSLRAGVVEQGWLPRTAQVMAHQVQQGPSRDAVATAGEYGRLPYSRSSVERVAHLVGALALADRQDSEDVLIDTFEVPSEARSVSVSLVGRRPPRSSRSWWPRGWTRVPEQTIPCMPRSPPYGATLRPPTGSTTPGLAGAACPSGAATSRRPVRASLSSASSAVAREGRMPAGSTSCSSGRWRSVTAGDRPSS